MSALKDLTGQEFNRLVIVTRAGSDRKKNATWVCVCVCGNLRVMPASDLRTDHTKSCGCLRKEFPNGRTHGMNRTPEYWAYCNAIQRCTNPDLLNWMNYGGRGIEFRFKSFEEFYAELGDKPEPKRKYSVDRIDNNGHYEVGNVRWATRKQQTQNRRATRLSMNSVNSIRKEYAAGGTTQLELAKKYGVARPTISHVTRNGTWKVAAAGRAS